MKTSVEQNIMWHVLFDTHLTVNFFAFFCFQVTARRPAVSRARHTLVEAAAEEAVTWARAAWASSTSATARRPARLRCRATCHLCRRYITRRPACPARRPSSRGTWSRRTWRSPATHITTRTIRPPDTCRSTAGTRPTARTKAFCREYFSLFVNLFRFRPKT